MVKGYSVDINNDNERNILIILNAERAKIKYGITAINGFSRN